jgi:hypothetical protein
MMLAGFAGLQNSRVVGSWRFLWRFQRKAFEKRLLAESGSL